MLGDMSRVGYVAVTCIVPATSKVEHAVQNFRIGENSKLNSKTIKNMTEFVQCI